MLTKLESKLSSSDRFRFSAGLFDLGGSSGTELVCLDSYGALELTNCKDLDRHPFTGKPELDHEIRIDDVNIYDPVQVLDVYDGILRTENVGKSTFGQTPLKGHLTAFKSCLHTAARAGILSAMTTTGRFSDSATGAATDSPGFFRRTLGWFKVVKHLIFLHGLDLEQVGNLVYHPPDTSVVFVAHRLVHLSQPQASHDPTVLAGAAYGAFHQCHIDLGHLTISQK
jgi:hypothetical protein